MHPKGMKQGFGAPQHGAVVFRASWRMRPCPTVLWSFAQAEDAAVGEGKKPLGRKPRHALSVIRISAQAGVRGRERAVMWSALRGIAAVPWRCCGPPRLRGMRPLGRDFVAVALDSRGALLACEWAFPYETQYTPRCLRASGGVTGEG